MSQQLNDFFDSATPAQINGLVSMGGQPPVHQHPAVAQQEMPQEATQLQDLPEIEAQPDQQVQENQQPVLTELPTQPSAEPTESPQQMRFRELREAKLRAEWERDDYARRLREAQQQHIQPQKIEEDEDYGVSPEDILDGKQLAKVMKKERERNERRTQELLRQQQQAFAANVVENRLRAEMPDIDSVVNNETVAQLKQQYPELAQSLAANTDTYSQMKSAYTLMRKLGIGQQAQPTYDFSADKMKIAQNLAKPKPIQTVSKRQSPLAQAEGGDGYLTEEMRTAIWKETQKYLR